MKNLQQLVLDAFQKIIEADSEIWAKCVQHVKHIEDDYHTKIAVNSISRYPEDGDLRFVVNLESDADDEMSDDE